MSTNANDYSANKRIGNVGELAAQTLKDQLFGTGQAAEQPKAQVDGKNGSNGNRQTRKSATSAARPKMKLPTLKSFQSKVLEAEEQAAADQELGQWETASREVIRENIQTMRTVRSRRPKVLSDTARFRYEEDETSYVRSDIHGEDERGRKQPGQGILQEIPYMRKSLQVIFLEEYVNSCPPQKSEIQFSVRMLIEAEVFVEVTGDEAVSAPSFYGQVVRLNPTLRQNARATAAAKKLLALIDEADLVYQKNRQADSREIEEQAGPIESRLTPDQYGKVDGLFIVLDPGYQPNQGKFRKGGKLLVQSYADGALQILRGTDGVERLAEEAKSRNIAIPLKNIESGQINTRDIEDEERGRWTWSIFNSLKRAIYRADDVAAAQAQANIERAELRVLENIIREQFHNREVGSYLVDRGHRAYMVPKKIPKRDEGGNVVKENGQVVLENVVRSGKVVQTPVGHNVFFLATREEAGGRFTVKSPDRLKGFFEKYPEAIGQMIKDDRKAMEREAAAGQKQKAEESFKDIEAQILMAAGEAVTETVEVAEATPAVEATAETAAAEEAQASEGTDKPKTKGRKRGTCKTAVAE